MTVDENISLFEKLMFCEGNVYVWCYDGDGRLLHSNCPQEMLFGTSFSLLGSKEAVYAHGREHSEPVICGTATGIVWAAAFEKEGDVLKRTFILGPVYSSEVSLAGIERGLKHYGKLDISLAWRNEFIKALETLPVVPNIIFSRYAIMLHHCITGQCLAFTDVHHASTVLPPELTELPQKDRHKVWQTEQTLLRMVKEGDLNYKSALNASSMLSNGVPVKVGEPLRQLKDTTIVFTSLCTRAAIEGGLSPELAYTLGDMYIQNVEDAVTHTDLSPIPAMMYEDFVLRVRKSRTNPKVSRQVQNCLDYIETHVGDKLPLKKLSQIAGYTEYYLTRKFKAEVGCTINDYIKFARVERAKELLTTTEDGIQAIAEQLGFCSRSYFGTIFSSVVGCSPLEYRNEHKRV